ncbi:MAM domain-containing protein [Trichonephila clavipes]|nr:MAM domain-containing protein [Trichonephila clavipes]
MGKYPRQDNSDALILGRQPLTFLYPADREMTGAVSVPISGFRFHLMRGDNDQWSNKDGQSFVRLTGCPNGQCGIAIMQSPWLDPRPSPSVLKLNYKMYGTRSVYLRLYLKAEDEAGQYTLFAKQGEYKFDFPKEWSKKEIILPATRSRHRVGGVYLTNSH